jgi:hypothetical protein
MENITLQGHYDGSQIRLDDPFDLQPNTKLLITILQTNDPEKTEWQNLSQHGLAAAYSQDEPEYPLTAIKESNPAYETG